MINKTIRAKALNFIWAATQKFNKENFPEANQGLSPAQLKVAAILDRADFGCAEKDMHELVGAIMGCKFVGPGEPYDLVNILIGTVLVPVKNPNGHLHRLGKPILSVVSHSFDRLIGTNGKPGGIPRLRVNYRPATREDVYALTDAQLEEFMKYIIIL